MDDLADLSEVESEMAEKERLSSIQAELAINTNDTGICQCCNKLIPPERLEFIPGALLCIKCQADFDQINLHRTRLHASQRNSFAQEESPESDS